MFELYQWILIAMAGFLIAALLSFWSSDRYFGTRYFEGLVKKKEVDFLKRQPRWKLGILRLLVFTTIISVAALWPVPILGAEFIDETLPWILVFWGIIALVSLGEFWFRDDENDAGTESREMERKAKI